MTSVTIEGITLHNVHPASACAGDPCVIHAPTDHHLRGWPLHWRGDRAVFERICPHGCGHPDPDQFAYWASIGTLYVESLHGCDGCCRPPVENADEELATAFQTGHHF